MTVRTQNEHLGQGVGFERIRRITGYLVGTMDKWNDAKRAEERDRVRDPMSAICKAPCPIMRSSMPAEAEIKPPGR